MIVVTGARCTGRTTRALKWLAEAGPDARLVVGSSDLGKHAFGLAMDLGLDVKREQILSARSTRTLPVALRGTHPYALDDVDIDWDRLGIGRSPDLITYETMHPLREEVR